MFHSKDLLFMSDQSESKSARIKRDFSSLGVNFGGMYTYNIGVVATQLFFPFFSKFIFLFQPISVPLHSLFGRGLIFRSKHVD